MRTTVFLALQCCNCSTMQVKQQKKSSNKWSCVVCNQKQSVRKVYAQGFMAKDVRLFVQSFNMSRQLAEQHSAPPPPPSPADQFPAKRRRTNYVEPDQEIKLEAEEEEAGDAYGPEIVTETPRESFEKPKLTKHYTAPDTTMDGEKALGFRPFFPKRNANKPSAATDKGSRKCQLTMDQKSPTWSDYVKEDGSDSSYNGRKGFPDDQGGELGHGAFDSAVDQRVEDEIHPDFM